MTDVTVVVVLDDPGLRAARPFEQLLPALQTHGQSQRKLARRSHIGEPRVTTGIRVDGHAIGVDRHRQHVCAGSGERAARTGVSRIFHPCRVAGIEQHVRDQVEAALRAHHHLDLVGIASGAARLHLLCDRLAKLTQPRELRVVELRQLQCTQDFARDLRPGAPREQIERRSPQPERARSHRGISPVRWRMRARMPRGARTADAKRGS